MESYVGVLADMYRRRLLADAGQDKERDPLLGAPRVRMMWWIAVDRLRRATVTTATGAVVNADQTGDG
jgi:hypothetical protein